MLQRYLSLADSGAPATHVAGGRLKLGRFLARVGCAWAADALRDGMALRQHVPGRRLLVADVDRPPRLALLVAGPLQDVDPR